MLTREQCVQEGRMVKVQARESGMTLFCRTVSISSNIIPPFRKSQYDSDITWAPNEVLEICECEEGKDPNDDPNEAESLLFSVKNGNSAKFSVRRESRKKGLLCKTTGYWVEPGVPFKIGGIHIWLETNEGIRYYIGETVKLPFMFESGCPERSITYQVAYDKYSRALLEGV